MISSADDPAPKYALRRSREFGKMAVALAKARGAMPSLVNDEKGTIPPKEGRSGYSYTYASLAQVLDAVIPSLSAQHIAIIQVPAVRDGVDVRVLCHLVHESDQWFEGELILRADTFAAQKIGTAISYARRYLLLAMLTLASEDNDGSGVGEGRGGKTGESAAATQTEQRPKSKPSYPDDEFRKNLAVWKKRIEDRKKSPDDIIATVESSFVLSDEQKTQIRAIKAAETEGAPA